MHELLHNIRVAQDILRVDGRELSKMASLEAERMQVTVARLDQAHRAQEKLMQADFTEVFAALDSAMRVSFCVAPQLVGSSAEMGSALRGAVCLTEEVAAFGRIMTTLVPKMDAAVRALAVFSDNWDLEATVTSVMVRVAERGWFFGPESSVFSDLLVGDVVGGNDDALDMWMVRHARRRLQVTQQGLCKRYPDRKEIFAQAFDAHRRAQYAVSVPSLLAQADGLWADRFGKSLFQRGGREVSDVGLDPWRRLILGRLLALPLPLWKSRKERRPRCEGLNRHRVLHGEDLGYGTERKSLQAICLLRFLCWLLDQPAHSRVREGEHAGGPIGAVASERRAT